MTGGGSGNAMRVETTSKQEGMVPFWVLGPMLNKGFVQSRRSLKNGNVQSVPRFPVPARTPCLCLRVKDRTLWHTKCQRVRHPKAISELSRGHPPTVQSTGN